MCYYKKIVILDRIKLKGISSKAKRIIIDGEKIKSESEFIAFMEKELCFPRPGNGIVDRYLDWMRDLSWLSFDSYEIYIINQNEFLKSNFKDRKNILNDFDNIILPYWEHDVLYQCVGGECKDFNVYLVDELES